MRNHYLMRFKLGVALLIVLAVPAILHSHAAMQNLRNHPPEWVPDSLPEKAEFNELSRRFSVSDMVMLSWPGATLDSQSVDQATEAIGFLCQQRGDNDSDDTGLDELSEATRHAIGEIREICRATAPLRWARSGTDTLERMMAAPARIPRRTAIARLRGSLVGPDGEQTCIVVSLAESGSLHRRRLLPKIREMIGVIVGVEASTVAMVGSPFDGAIVDDESVRSIETFSPPSAVIAAILCFICLRSIWLTGVITAIAVIGEGLVMAAVHYSGTPMNAVLIVLPPLVFVLTVSAGIHLSNYFLDAAHEFADLTSAGAAKRAMRAGTPPCLLATGTTVVGLGSLMLVRLEPIRLFGLVASLGVITTLALMVMILPGAMVLTRPRRPTGETRGEVSAIRKWFRTRTRVNLARPWPLVLLFLIVGGYLASGLLKLETTISVPRMFQADSDIRQSYDYFRRNVGPTVTGDLLISFQPPSADDDPLKRLDIIKNVHLRAHQIDSVDGVLSAMSFVPAIPRSKRLAATATRAVIRKLIRDPDSSLSKLDFISRDEAAEVWRISLRMRQDETTDLSAELAKIRATIIQQLSDSQIPVTVSMTGHVAIVQRAQEVLLADLFRSFLSAFAVVAVVMVFLLRSLRGGLIAMIPNLFPTVALFGLMGLARSPLDIGSVMTASVALGIAVDDTVHLLSRFGSRRARGFGQIRAAFGALGQCGWAMLQTTLVCGLSLMAYWFSDFVPTSRFALLMFGLLLAALLGDVLLLPGLMASPLGRWLSRTIGTSANADAALSSDLPEKPNDTRRLPVHWRLKRKRRK